MPAQRGELWDDPLGLVTDPLTQTRLDDAIRRNLQTACNLHGVPCHYTVIYSCRLANAGSGTVTGISWAGISPVLETAFPGISKFMLPQYTATQHDWSYLIRGTIVLNSRWLPRDLAERADQVRWLYFQLSCEFARKLGMVP